MNNLCTMEIKMSNYSSFTEYDDQAYQDYLEELFHEFLQSFKIACMLPKSYTQPNDLNHIKIFWEVA